VDKITVIYAKFILDVACQKLLKLANIPRSYSKNKSGFLFLEHGVYIKLQGAQRVYISAK